MTPAKIKVKVATRERAESLPSPQTPCPDVQPLPSLVPIPTIKPAKTNSPKLLVIGKFNSSGFRNLKKKPPAIIPKIKKCRQRFPLIFKLKILEYIPLIPATCPNNQSIKELAKPIKTPPTKGFMKEFIVFPQEFSNKKFRYLQALVISLH